MKKTGGFSMLELMIVIAVIAITLVWAIPSYEDSVRKAKRSEAQSKMREFEVCAARRFTIDSNFSNADSCHPDPDAEDEDYTYTVVDGAASYTITATPKGRQADDKCGTMTMVQTGAATPTTVGCW